MISDFTTRLSRFVGAPHLLGDADAEQWLTSLYEVVGTPPDMQVASAR